ncbi:MAG: Mfa1 family fimbria major subunit [Prevotella sp.]|nr:Mfa1 family fimbria major subunit [Prevotella sp.]
MKKLFLAMMACAGLCACSSDDIDLASSTQKVFDTDVAYMKVNLSEVGSSATRASFVSGSDEYNVSNAHFYFYDSDGNFITKGEIDDTFNWTSGSDGANVENSSGNVVILEGLTNKAYPQYVVTILNQPDNFTPGTTLERMEGLYANGIYDDPESNTPNFIMSTSSYLGASDAYSFVTELSDGDFTTSLSAAQSKTDAVKIYVERLAAKVTLGVSSEISNVEDNDYYKIGETIGGEENNEEDGEAVTDIYVKILGWKLNATAKNSYMMKNLDSNWTDDDTNGHNPWSGWNDDTNYRSYWCKSYNYGQSGSNTYLTYNDLQTVNELDDVEYCAENTNSVYDENNSDGIIKSKNSPAITSILVKAQAYHKVDGSYSEISLIRYKGLLFDLDGFFNAISIEKGVYDEDGNALSSQSGLSISTANDGTLSVAVSNDNTYYSADGSQADTPSFDGITFSYYKDGLMYYTIPIEHLNNSGELAEGYYGVVRNHYYKVTINSLANIGKAVYSETDQIVPDEDEEEEVNYYLPATINILSWNEVDQGADL